MCWTCDKERDLEAIRTEKEKWTCSGCRRVYYYRRAYCFVCGCPHPDKFLQPWTKKQETLHELYEKRYKVYILGTWSPVEE